MNTLAKINPATVQSGSVEPEPSTVIARWSSTTVKAAVRPTTPQKTPSVSAFVYWSKPAHGGVAPENSSFNRMFWKDSTIMR